MILARPWIKLTRVSGRNLPLLKKLADELSTSEVLVNDIFEWGNGGDQAYHAWARQTSVPRGYSEMVSALMYIARTRGVVLLPSSLFHKFTQKLR